MALQVHQDEHFLLCTHTRRGDTATFPRSDLIFFSHARSKVWTFAFDVSGVKGVEFFYREDADGFNPIDDDTNELYEPEKHGLSGVGPWRSMNMTYRQFPKGNHSNVDFFVLPKYIADEYWIKVDGLRNVLIDYYVQVLSWKPAL